MTTLINTAQEKTLSAIRESLLVFSDIKEDSENIIKRGRPTSLKVSFETELGIFQYQINSSGSIIKMDEVSKNGIHLRSFTLKSI